MQPIIRVNDERIDELEAAVFEAALSEDTDIEFVDCPLNHEFFPNLYVRQILMPKGTTITSKIHKTCHPFRVLQGIVWVKIDDEKWEKIEAPYQGATKVGTRRVLFIEENTVWETFHALPFINGSECELSEQEYNIVLEKIENEILEPYENKLLGGSVFLNQIKALGNM